MLQYLIKFSISLAVLFLFYRVVLRPLTFYQCNRFYLLGYSLLAFFIPFIDISAWYPVSDSQQLNNFVLPINYSITSNNAAYFVNQPAIKLFWWQQLSSTQWLLIVFSLGALAMLGRLLMQYRSLYSIRRNAVLLDTQEGIQLYETNVKVSPFSFGNAIFFNRQLHTEEELGRIIQHEFVHVRQKHTIDLLTGELLCIVNWFNPFAWFIRYSIRQNLEFIADNKVLNNGLDRKEYQYLLLKAIGAPQYSMGNNFNFSNLKKRIIMMNKIKSSRIHLAKFLFVLPLMAVLFLAFRQKTTANNKSFVFTGIVYDVNTMLPLKDVLVSEKMNAWHVKTDANGFFTVNIPVTDGKIFMVSWKYELDGLGKSDSRSLFMEANKEARYNNIMFTGIDRQKSNKINGIFINEFSESVDRNDAQLLSDEDYKFVQQKFNAFKIDKQLSDKIDLLIKDSKKPIWVIDGKPFAIGDGSRAWFNKDEYTEGSSFKVWVDGKVMSMDEANALVNRFEVKQVGAWGAADAIKKYGVNSSLLVLYWKTRPSREINSIDTVPALAPPVQDGAQPALAPPVPDAAAPNQPAPLKRADALQPNKKGYIVTVADNDGECVVIVKDKQRKIVKAVQYAEWNKNKSDYVQKYGDVLMPPPPPPPSIGAPVLAPPAVDGVSPVAAPAPPTKVSINNIPDDMLILVDGVEKTKAEIIALPGSEIKEINILSSKEAQNLYWLFGEKGKKGVMRITTKHPVKITDKSAQIQPKDIPAKAGYDSSPKPLYIVDGKTMPEGFTINELDANSIAAITILKDKTSTVKYGSQGMNGVILITSKDKKLTEAKAQQPIIKWEDPISIQKVENDSTVSMKTGDETGFVEVFFKKNGIRYNPQNVLIVIDGTALPADAQLNDYVKQDNIEQIVVTKDKSAVDKYGDRAKNGVIEVKTKTAGVKKSEPASFNFESFQSNGHMEGDGNNTMVKGEFSFKMSSNKTPLLVVNGVAKPAVSSFSNKDKNKTTRMQFVDEKNAIAQYGADAKNGALLVNIL
ncbi:MAG: M56 family metallopeptidase [Chitinophagaceae bacterium]